METAGKTAGRPAGKRRLTGGKPLEKLPENRCVEPLEKLLLRGRKTVGKLPLETPLENRQQTRWKTGVEDRW